MHALVLLVNVKLYSKSSAKYKISNCLKSSLFALNSFVRLIRYKRLDLSFLNEAYLILNCRVRRIPIIRPDNRILKQQKKRHQNRQLFSRRLPAAAAKNHVLRFQI